MTCTVVRHFRSVPVYIRVRVGQPRSTVCIYASMHLCIYAPMHLCTYASMHLCIYASMHLCIYASIYSNTYIYIRTSTSYAHVTPLFLQVWHTMYFVCTYSTCTVGCHTFFPAGQHYMYIRVFNTPRTNQIRVVKSFIRVKNETSHPG